MLHAHRTHPHNLSHFRTILYLGGVCTPHPAAYRLRFHLPVNEAFPPPLSLTKAWEDPVLLKQCPVRRSQSSGAVHLPSAQSLLTGFIQGLLETRGERELKQGK